MAGRNRPRSRSTTASLDFCPSASPFEIIRLFEEFSKNFDRGGLEERYVQEQIFNDKFCVGIYNNYYAEVEEYCVMCTVTRLRKKL